MCSYRSREQSLTRGRSNDFEETEDYSNLDRRVDESKGSHKRCVGFQFIMDNLAFCAISMYAPQHKYVL